MSEYNPTYDRRNISYANDRYWLLTGNRNRFVDPKRLMPHRLTGTTTTLQTWNNPKRIHGFNSITWKLINNASIWNAGDDPDNV